MIGFGQNVNIPDVNFKAYLVGNSLINTNGDTEIQVSEANAFNGTIFCSQVNISDLTGIEAFTSLTVLYCQTNQLTSIDVSNNTALTALYFSYNQLTSINVSNNTALDVLECDDNQLNSLDVSQNTFLDYLKCDDNQLTVLDVSQNTALRFLWCGFNQITSLDVSNNIALIQLLCENNQLINLNVKNGNNYAFFTDIAPTPFYCENNPLLTCIEVDDAAYSTTNWTYIDPQHYFSTNCSGTSLQEHATYKEILKITDLLGRETKGTKNEPLFYIYDDGTVEKRITID